MSVPALPEVTTVEVDRSDPLTTRVTTEASSPLHDGQARCRVDGFAVTSNNVTYARTGEMLGYWAFFPVAEPWGRVPAWGHATVIESRHPEVPEGRQVFGFVPMGSHLVLQPGRLTATGFVDASPARAALPSAYNLYLDPQQDRLHAPGTEDLQCVLRPLFITSWVLDGLHERSWPGATVVMSSASSKTAIGTAHLLAGRNVATVGVTSARSRAFVESLGVYDRVLTYGEVGELSDDEAVYYDFAGSSVVRREVHDALGDRLRRSAMIGFLHEPGAEELRTGPEPEGFFAPAEIRARVRELGPDEFERRLAAAWHHFRAWSETWLTLVSHRTAEDAAAAFRRTASGDVAPDQASVCHL